MINRNIYTYMFVWWNAVIMVVVHIYIQIVGNSGNIFCSRHILLMAFKLCCAFVSVFFVPMLKVCQEGRNSG